MKTFPNPVTSSMDSSMVDTILEVEKELSRGPKLSIRFRITLAFAIAILFSFAMGISSMIFISRLNTNHEIVNRAGNLVLNVERARRHEKNFFLYNAKTDIFDALASIHVASEILQNESQGMRSLVAPDVIARLRKELTDYISLLTDISKKSKIEGKTADAPDVGIEAGIRITGHRVLTYATELMNQARLKVHSRAQMFMTAAVFSLIINLIVMVWLASELARQILQPLGRAVEYTERIAAGDFRPVTPARKYRDEFSTLAIAINCMIRELVEKHDQLLQSRKMAAVGTLTSGIAHELNNPLNNISLTTETLIEDLDGFSHEETIEMLKDIFVQVERAGATVRDLLDFTRRDKTIAEPVSVAELVESSLKLVENECSLANVESENRIKEDLPRVRGNFRSLQQVVLNLLINAIQAMPDGGLLLLDARSEETGWLRIDVTDTGVGIPEEILERAFDPFFTTKEVGTGTGLGLSVSYGIIEKMGGRITVQSEVGSGTTFSVFLHIWEDESQTSDDAQKITD